MQKQKAGAADAKWRGKGLPPPSLAIYRSGEAALPKTARIVRINCRQPRLLLTDGPNVTKRPDLRAHAIITAQ
jgi:hypothetical protein